MPRYRQLQDKFSHYCAKCKAKIERDTTHIIDTQLCEQMYHPRYHIDCAPMAQGEEGEK
jgi:hypothetical protein